MIVEGYPEIQALSVEQQLTLAAELCELATDSTADEPDPEIVRILNKRLEQFRAHPESASTWSEVKNRILNTGNE